jgi:hypothetical protein
LSPKKVPRPAELAFYGVHSQSNPAPEKFVMASSPHPVLRFDGIARAVFVTEMNRATVNLTYSGQRPNWASDLADKDFLKRLLQASTILICTETVLTADERTDP